VVIKSSARLRAALLALGTAPLALTAALAAEEATPKETKLEALLPAIVAPPSAYHIEKLGNRGIKLTSKNPENSYAITVLGSNAEAGSLKTFQAGEAWQKSLGVQFEGKLGSFLKTDLSTRFTELQGTLIGQPFGVQTPDIIGIDRRALEEITFTTQFLGDRVAVTSSRRASNRSGFDTAMASAKGESEQDRFKAWLWRSDKSSLSIEGVSSRVDSGFQSLAQPTHMKSEESQQLRSKLSYGRVGVFVAQRESLTLGADRTTMLSHQSDIETGATLGLSDLRQGEPLLFLLPDSVWISTNHGSVEQGAALAYEARPMEKSSIGMTRSWKSGSVNLSYWQSAVEGAPSFADESQWHGSGMDIGGTLKSGRVSMSGNITWYTADTLAALSNTSETNVNGSFFLTWSRAAWPKLSAGITNYAYQSMFLDYGGLEASSLTRYELNVDSSSLLSAWRDPAAQLKFIASYQGNTTRSQWAQAVETGASDVFLGLKFTRSLLP
jgi:hypothetical protein